MEMILLGIYNNKKEKMILYSQKQGKCILLNKPKELDTFLYSYFNKIKMNLDKYNEIMDFENMGPCDINGFLESVKFASNNLKVLNAPKKNNVIIYLEGASEIIKLNGDYILNFNYIRGNYSYSISDKSIISYLNKSKDNINILNKYTKSSKIILVIMKNTINEISIIKMHSIKMGLKL